MNPLHHKKRVIAIVYYHCMFWNKRIYLDESAGVSPNPSSPHEEGRQAKEQLQAARTRIARLLEVKPDDVVFTSGATQANALAILGVVRAAKQRAPETAPHCLYLPSAHASVVENMKLLRAEGVRVEELPVHDASVDVVALQKLLRKETVLVSMDAVCGETGVVWNTREVRHALDLARESGEPPIYFHVDASQAPRTEKISRAHFGADLLTFDASKISTLRGIGCLVAHRTIPLLPLYAGGGQERGLISGSESAESATAFADALSTAVQRRDSFKASAHTLRKTLIEKLVREVPHIYVQEGKAQAPHIVNISLPRRDTDYLVALLDKEGFAVSTRSACETDSLLGSRAVYALTGDQERAKSTLRVSWGPDIRARHLRAFADAFGRAVAFVDRGDSR